jgi:predicted enzyme related to lactoylglutathione lyase
MRCAIASRLNPSLSRSLRVTILCCRPASAQASLLFASDFVRAIARTKSTAVEFRPRGGTLIVLFPALTQIGGLVITKTDFIGVPSTDSERSRRFYVETLGLRPDECGKYEFWAGDTCFGIWEPAQMGMEFAPQKNAHPALHVDDVAAARVELEGKGVEFNGETMDTGVCHMALFTDPDGNDLMLHHRYAPYK